MGKRWTICSENKNIVMAKMMKYKYIAVLNPIENRERYYAHVPDLKGCVTSGSNLQDAIEMITDVASIWLVCAEDKEFTIPTATPAKQLACIEGAIFSEINMDTTAYRKEIAD